METKQHILVSTTTGPGPGTGFLGEAVAFEALSQGAQKAEWLGGRTPDYDLIIDGLTVQVKSADLAVRVFKVGSPGEAAIGIKPAVVPAERKRVIVTPDWYACVTTSGLASRRKIANQTTVVRNDVGTIEVTSTSTFVAPDIYLISGASVRATFVRPLRKGGQEYKSTSNLWAPLGALRKWEGATALRDF